MRKTSIFLLFALVCSVCHAQINHDGLPFSTYYQPNSAQTMSIAQDKRGVIYFANDDGVVEYDGVNWNTIRELYARSVDVDDNNIVHVGFNGDFGYLYPNETGTLEFISMASKLPDSTQIDDITKTYCKGTKTYYCSSKCIFIADQDSIVKIVDLPENSFWSYMLGDTLLVSNIDGYLSLFYNDSLHSCSPRDTVANGLYGAVPFKNGTYLLTTGAALYEATLDGKKAPKNINSSNSFFNKFYINHFPYSLERYGDKLVMTTVWGGVYTILVLDTNLNITAALNPQNGLKSVNGLSSLMTGHILWSGMENSISKSDIGSGLRHFGAESGLSGCINTVIKKDGKLYVGTSAGMFVQNTDEYGMPRFDPIYSEDKSDLFGANDYIDFKVPNSNRTILLAAGDVGLYSIENGIRKRLVEISSCECLLQSETNPKLLYVGTYNNLLCYEYTGNSKKPFKPVYEALNGMDIESIVEADNGDIWCTTFNNGVIRITNNGKSFMTYDEENGLRTTNMVYAKKLDNKILFYSPAGVYEFNEEASEFIPTQYINGNISDTTIGTWDILPFDNGYIASLYLDGHYWLKHIVKDSDGSYKTAVGNPFNKIRIANQCYIYVDDEGLLWLFDDETLYSYNPKLVDRETPYYLAPFNTLIRQVSINDSVVLFGGTFKAENGLGIALKQPKNSIVELPYKDNSLTFYYSSTFFDDENNTEYSTMLEGDDKSWSKWKKGTEYSRRDLKEGKYTFKVKARNIYGVESSVAEYSFSIRAPFYRTIVAYLLYVVLLVVFVYGIVKWNTRRLIEEKKKLEQKIAEATEEIRGQNEQLEQQKDEIEKQKDEIQSSINYARRIQRALLTPDEVIDKIFPDHFLLYKPRNVVSGDYYWFGQFGDNKVSIVADCTGHGVPGGFMSMLGMTNLNYIVGQELRPDEILNKLRNAIITSLRQKDDTPAPTGDPKVDRRAAFAAATEKKDRSQDGMDVAMYVINEKEMTLSFAGANNPLVLIRDGEVQVIKASKMPVGIYAKLDPFERVDMELKKGDCLYTFSDGFQDQFGFESGKKFMSKHLREVLLEIHQKPMAEQKEILNKTYEDWRGPADHQTDDVVLMGVRIN